MEQMSLKAVGLNKSFGTKEVLENLDLTSVFPEDYILCALPLKIRGAEASMVRAVLLTED